MWKLWKRMSIAEIMCDMALENSRRGRIMMPPSLPLGRGPISGGRGAPSQGTPPKGFALGELLLVLATCGLVVGILAVAGLVVIDQSSDHEQQAAHDVTRREAEVMRGCEILLGDEFVCTVTLLEHVVPDPHRPPEYLSVVRVACRDASASEVFLLEITKNEHPSHGRPATCGTWNLMSEDAVQARALERREAEVGSIQLTEDELQLGSMFYEKPEFRYLSSLEEPLLLLVPPHLPVDSVLVLSSECDKQDLAAIDDFPVERLAASIRSATRNDHWEPGNLHALLRRYDAGNRWLSEDEERTIARLVVRRLLDDLPQ